MLVGFGEHEVELRVDLGHCVARAGASDYARVVAGHEHAEPQAERAAARARDPGIARGASVAASRVLALQRSVGNRNVARLLARQTWDKAWAGTKTPIEQEYATFKSGIGTGQPGGTRDIAAASSHGGTRLWPIELTLDELKAILLPEPPVDQEAHARRLSTCLPPLNQAFRIMKIDTVEAQAVFLAHTAGETGTLAVLDSGQGLTEKGASSRPYAPFVGRGPIQVTHRPGYMKSLAYTETAAERLAAQATANDATIAATHAMGLVEPWLEPETTQIRADATLANEAVAAIKADITKAADTRYAFLFSAAMMQWTPGAKNAASLGSAASFAGGKPADQWVSGAKQPWATTKAEAEAKLKAARDRLARPAVAGDGTDAAERAAAEKAVKSATATINDMASTISRATVKEATYRRAFAELSKKAVKK